MSPHYYTRARSTRTVKTVGPFATSNAARRAAVQSMLDNGYIEETSTEIEIAHGALLTDGRHTVSGVTYQVTR